MSSNTDPNTEPQPQAAEDQSLQGWVPELAQPQELFQALEQAFDYRGDITITTRDGRRIEGYLFDRRVGQGLEDSHVRLLPADAEERMSIRYDQIARLEFSGKDTAQGKSWETWVKKYAKKKLREKEQRDESSSASSS